MQEIQETQVRSLPSENPLEEEMATHSSILAWKIPWTEEPGGLSSMRSQRAGHDWMGAHTDRHIHIIDCGLTVGPVSGSQYPLSPSVRLITVLWCLTLLILISLRHLSKFNLNKYTLRIFSFNCNKIKIFKILKCIRRWDQWRFFFSITGNLMHRNTK